MLGKIFLKEQDVNLNMVKSGNAHWNEQFKYQQSFIEQRIYKANQKQAKKSKLGLWQSSNVILPSEWRYKNKETKTNK